MNIDCFFKNSKFFTMSCKKVYYKLIDNEVIVDSLKEDIYSLQLKDIIIDERFLDCLKEGYFPILNGEIEKEFVYDFIENKVVLEKENYSDSNLALLKVDNSYSNIEKIINDNKKGLLGIEEGFVILKDVVIDPYYFSLTVDNNDKKILDMLKDNNLLLKDRNVEGEYLSNNIYFDYLYGTEDIKDLCEYLFVYNKDKEFIVDDKIIYVGYDLKNDFIDLKNKEAYMCGYMDLGVEKVSTFKKNKVDVSEFKLYLVRNKGKFSSNITKIIELI